MRQMREEEEEGEEMTCECEEKIRKLRFEIDLIEERQNQWIERIKTLEEKLKIKKVAPSEDTEELVF